MRVLVTGAGGFIGRHLTRVLLERGTLAGPGGKPLMVHLVVNVEH